MAYTSKAQIITRWGTDEVILSADRDPQDGAVDEGAVAAACDGASSLIDSYLAKAGYKVPVNPAPAVLVDYASDIAVYKLSSGPGPYTAEKRKRYEDAIAWLEALAGGDKALLPDASEDSEPARDVRTSGFPFAYQAVHLRGGGLL